MSRKLLWLFGLVAIYNFFVFHSFGSTGFVIGALTLYLFVLGVFWNGKLPIWSTVFVLILSAAMIRSANGLVNLVCGAAILTTTIGLGYLLAAKRFFFGVGEMLLSPVVLLWSYALSVLNIFKIPKPKARFLPMVRGLILGLPLLLVIAGLLASADPVYGGFLTSLIKNIRPFITHVIISMVLLGLFLPYALLKLKGFPKTIYSWVLPIATEVNIIVGLVIAALGSFLIVQWPYIFVKVAAETSLSQFGAATYSEYVKRGFGEFIVVAMIVYALAWAGVWIKKASPLLQTVLFGEFFVFILSIFRRVALYQQYHGWTLARIYGGFLLVWVTGLMVILLWRYFAKRNLLIAEVFFTALVIVAFSWFNAEKFIFETKPPTVNNRVDYVYLSRLSADGVTGWNAAIDYADRTLNAPEYDTKLILNREDRREINYANFVLNALANNYEEMKIRAQKTGTLNKLFLYNYSEDQVWREWEKDRGQELEQLKKAYLKLNDRIQKQPENERDWDLDISMTSAFF